MGTGPFRCPNRGLIPGIQQHPDFALIPAPTRQFGSQSGKSRSERDRGSPHRTQEVVGSNPTSSTSSEGLPLLRQPERFERLRLIPVRGEPDDPSVSQFEDGAAGLLHLHPIAPEKRFARENQDVVA